MVRTQEVPAYNRRDVLKIAGVSGSVGMAGCMSDDENGNQTEDGPDEDLSGDLIDQNGDQVTLTLVYPTASDNVQDAAQYMGQALEDNLGIAVEQEAVPFNTMLERYAAQVDEDGNPLGYNAGDRDEYTGELAWDLMWGIGFNTYPRSPETTATFWAADGGTNFYGYEPEEDIGGMLVQAGQSNDPEERESLFSEVFGILSEDLPTSFVQFAQDIDAYQGHVVHTEEPSLEGIGWGYKFQTWHFSDDYDGDGRYTTVAGSEARDLNPYRIADTTSGALAAAVLDGTYTFDTDDEFHGRWLESMETDDNQVFECTLRDNLHWSDPYGQMTTEDWVFFVENVVTYEENWTGHVNRGQWWIGDEPIEIERVDDLTFRLVLPEPSLTFPFDPAMWGAQILPKALTEPYFEDYVDGNDEAGNELNSSEEVQGYQYTGNLGPYKFVERRIEDRTIFERNDEYYMRAHGGEEWADAPYFDEYVIRVIEEEATRLAELEAGGLSHAGLPVDDADRFEEMEDITVVQNATPFCSILAFNQRANGWEPLRTKEVRQALAHAIDKEVIVENIYDGFTSIAHTFQPEWSQYYDDSQVVEFGEGDSFDPDRGRQLLNEHLPSEYGFE